MDIVSTSAFILRKTPYLSSGIILAVLTQHHGLRQFIVRHGRREKVGLQGHIDLFQEINIEFALPTSSQQTDLIKPQLIEVHHDFGELPQRYSCFVAMGKLAAFLLRNLENGIALPKVYQSLIVAAQRLSSSDIPESIAIHSAISGVLLTLLHEEGLLPTYADEAMQKRCNQLQTMALKQTISPSLLSETTWQAVEQWLIDLAAERQLYWNKTE